MSNSIVVTTLLRRSNSRGECRRCKVDTNFTNFHNFREKISALFRANLDENACFFYTDQHNNQVAFSSDEELEIAYEFVQNNELKVIVEDFLAFVSSSGDLLECNESSFLSTSDDELSDLKCSDPQQESSFREIQPRYHSEALYTANLPFSGEKISQSQPVDRYNASANPRSSCQFNQLNEFRKCEKDDVKQKLNHMPSISQRTAGGLKRNAGQNTPIKQTMVAQTRSKGFPIQELNYSVASSSTASSDSGKQSVPKETSQSAVRTRTLKLESHNDRTIITRQRITTSSVPEMDSSAHGLQRLAENWSMTETSSVSVPQRVLESRGKDRNFKTDVKLDSDIDSMTQSLQKPTPRPKTVEEHGNSSGKQNNQNGLRADVKTKQSSLLDVARSPLSVVPNQNGMSTNPAVNVESKQVQLPQRASPDGSEVEGQSTTNEAVHPTPNKKVAVRKGRNRHSNRSDEKPKVKTPHLDSWVGQRDRSSFLKQEQVKRPSLECLGQILLTAVVIGFVLFLRR